MSNHDLTIANGPGINVRQDIEAALQALGSTFQGGAVPLATYACQMWADSTNLQLKIRNIANTAWIVLGALDAANFGHLPLTGGALAGPGNLTMAGTLGVSGGTAQISSATAYATLQLNKAAGANSNQIVGYTVASARWQLHLGDTAAEGGSNAGSNLALYRFTDAGSFIDAPLTIYRATGGIVLTVAGNQLSNQPHLNSAIAGIVKGWYGSVNGLDRWGVIVGNSTPEGGSNAGSDFTVNRFNDAGVFIDSPMRITRATGNVNFDTNTVTVGNTGTSSATLSLVAPAGTNRQIVGSSGASPRWLMQLGDTVAESGGNAGSNFSISRYSDAGALIDTPFTINRSNGFVSTTTPFSSGSSIFATNALVINGPVANAKQLVGQSLGSNRWLLNLGDGAAETGGNAGTNMNLTAQGDTGASIGVAFSVVRSTWIVTFTKAIVNGPSDRRLKENVAPLTGSLEKVLALQGVSFDLIDDPEHERQIGLIAQDVLPIVPEVVQNYHIPRLGDDEINQLPAEPPLLGLDYPKLTALLIEAVKELSAKVTTLEGVTRQ